ncbi:Uncharacterised protein [Chlamydia trachomatis]|nr:Uncharacterised protein [Chlamydia trachomatis]
MAVELSHEGLAETHDLSIGLALRVEVGATLATTNRQASQGVLEDLFEAKELNDRQVDGRVEAQTALVRADRGVELNAVAAVHLDLAVAVHPGDTEHDLAFRFDNAFEDLKVSVFRLAFGKRSNRQQDLVNGLVEFGLARVAGNNGLVNRSKSVGQTIHIKCAHALIMGTHYTYLTIPFHILALSRKITYFEPLPEPATHYGIQPNHRRGRPRRPRKPDEAQAAPSLQAHTHVPLKCDAPENSA